MDPYQTLGIKRDAGDADIKKAYRKLAKELHPDRNGDNPKAVERFGAVTRAYDLLSDTDKRARYDRGEIDGDGNPKMPFGFDGGGGAGPRGNPFGAGARPDFGDAATADLGDLFENLFGRGGGAQGGFGGGGPFGGARRPPPTKGADVAYRLQVPFVDAAAGKPQRVTLAGGTTIDLKLPGGVEDGARVRLPAKGQDGPGGPGDAIVTIAVQPHAFFTRDGDDVRIDLPVTLKEAVEGAKVRVPTIDGPVTLSVPAGSNSGRTLRLRGKGWTRKDGTRGDGLVRLFVDVPANDPALADFVRGWPGGGNPRAHLGV